MSPDGTTLAVAHQRTDNTSALYGAAEVRIWDVATGKMTHTLFGHINRVNGLAFSPDGRLLAVGLRDGTVALWDVAARRRLFDPVAGRRLRAGDGCGAGAEVIQPFTRASSAPHSPRSRE